MKKFKIVYLFLLAFVLIGCASNVNIDIFRFVNHENTIQVGQTINLQLIMGDYPEDSEVKYTLNKEGIISFENGVAEGLAVGEVEVKATVDNIKFATTKVIVNKEPVDALQILASKNTLFVGEELELDIKIFPSHLSKKVTWKIEIGTDNATISENGVLTAIKGEKNTDEITAGGAKVRVVATSEEGLSAKRDFFVKYKSTTVVTLTAPDDKTEFLIEELEANKSIKLDVGHLPVNSFPVVSFTTSNPEILLVDQTGLVTFPEILKEGTVTITAKTLDNIEGTITFKIVAPDVESTPEEPVQP